MLTILKKISERQTRFSAKELRGMGQYFSYLSQQGATDNLKQVWQYLPDDKRADALIDALEIERHEAKVDKSHALSSVIFLLSKMEETLTPELWHQISDDSIHEMIRNIAKCDSPEAVESFVDLAARHLNKADIIKMLPFAGSGIRNAPMLDKLVGLCETWGGAPLVQKLMDSSIMSVVEIALSETTDAQNEFLAYLMQKQHEISGTTLLIKNTNSLFEHLDKTHAEHHQRIIASIFENFYKLGGTRFIKKAFAHDDWAIPKMMAYYDVPLLTRTIQSLAGRIRTKEFAEQVNSKIAISWYLGTTFEHMLAITLDEAKSGLISANDVEEQLTILCKKWTQENLSGQTFYSDADGRNASLRSMVAGGHHKALRDFSELHEIFGEPSLYPEALMHYGEMITTPNAELITQLFNYAYMALGKNYVRSLIVQEINGDNIFDHIALSYNKAAIAAILEIAGKVGGQTFVDRLLAGPEQTYTSIRSCEIDGNADIARYLIEKLSPGLRESVYDKLHLKWRDLADKKITKTNFYNDNTSGLSRWLGMTGGPPPHVNLEGASPYHFKRKLYDAILPSTQLASEIEKNTGAESNAHKLSVLFSSFEEADIYLTSYVENWGGGTRQPVHDACLFVLPDLGQWHPSKWRKLILKEGPAIFPYLSRAADIEEHIGKNQFPEDALQLKSIASQMTYKRALEHPVLAEQAGHSGYNNSVFNELLDWHLKNAKKSDYIPPVSIDGSSIGHANFYLSRLAPDDTIAYFLGHTTKCCQSFNGVGRACVEYGMKSPYSGFYVWRQKTKGEITGNDPIVAQSWAWIGQDNTLVFDSFEREQSVFDTLAQPFIEQFAHQVAGKYTYIDQASGLTKTLTGVSLGTGGNTPVLGIEKRTSPSLPIDYKGRYTHADAEARDSFAQYGISPYDHASHPRPKLPIVMSYAETERLAQNYIRRTLAFFGKRYGLKIKTGIECECYAVNKNGVPSSEILEVPKVQADLVAAGFDVHFDHENAKDRKGQFEFSTSVDTPLKTVATALGTQNHLKQNAEKYGVKSFNFQPLPYKRLEASGIHISLSLWSQDNKPLFSGTTGPQLLNGILSGMLDFQRYTILAVAQTDADYLRFRNTDWSPHEISAGVSGGTGISLRIANANGNAEFVDNPNPEDIRIEDRSPSASSNLMIAMAMTLAGVDLALRRYFDGSKDLFPICPQEDMDPLTKIYPLPFNRYEALEALKTGLEGDLRGTAVELLRAIARQHTPHDLQISHIGELNGAAEISLPDQPLEVDEEILALHATGRFIFDTSSALEL